MKTWIVITPSLLMAVLLFSGCDHPQKDPDSLYKTLNAHSLVLPVSPKGDITIPSGFLDDLMAGSRVILTGEGHGISANYPLRRAFLLYLKDRVDLDYLLLELGPSQAGVLNQYLKTGDTELLDRLYAYWEGTYEWTQESYAFWPFVYAFNQTLPVNERLVCVGIDVEHQPAHAVTYLKSLLPEKEAPLLIAKHIQGVRLYPENQANGFDLGTKLSTSIKANPKTYKDFLGEAFFEFKIVTDSLEAARQAYASRQSDGNRTAFSQIRDKQMYDNFLAYHGRLRDGTYWGHFGTAHIFKKRTDHVDWFGAHLQKKTSPVADCVLSILFGYNGGERMSKKFPGYFTSPIPRLSPGPLDFHRGPEPVLIDLHQFTSRALAHPSIISRVPGANTDYVDCLLLIKDATATVPLFIK
ncbi:MAG: erythromycin esterase family protein [Planctomycetes bacterium]|nr:erythromycin esterase family protein [Planctomycetota bacterium]